MKNIQLNFSRRLPWPTASACAATLLFGVTSGYGQLTIDGTTNVISGVTQDLGNSTVKIGDTLDYSKLIISNGGVLKNGQAVFGEDLSFYNSAIVTGAGSLWTNSMDIVLGGLGWNNSLNVADGGTVYAEDFILAQQLNGNGNATSVQGVGSLLALRGELEVGVNGVDNSLLVFNEGLFTQAGGRAQIGTGPSASANKVTIAGANSRWEGVSKIFVGSTGGSSAGSANQLIIQNGAEVSADNISVGGTGASSVGNDLVVSNATLNVTSNLVIELGSVFFDEGSITVNELLVNYGNFGKNGFFFTGGGDLIVKSKLFVVPPFADYGYFDVGDGANTASLTLLNEGGVDHWFNSGLRLLNQASLKGHATLEGDCQAKQGSVIDPGTGSGTGILGNKGDLSLEQATLKIVINGPSAGTEHDQLHMVSGSLSFNDAVLDVSLNYIPPYATAFTIIRNGGSLINEPFLGYPEGTIFTNNSVVLQISYLGGAFARDVVLTVVEGAARDFYYNEITTPNYQTAGNWTDATLPRSIDTGNFTNSSNYTVNWLSPATAGGALFNAESGTATLDIAPHSWQLNDRFIIGTLTSANPSVTHTAGTLSVTNSAGTALLEVHKGNLTLDQGTIIANRLLLTNNTGTLTFKSGHLITDLATLDNGANFDMGEFMGVDPIVWEVRSNALPSLLTGALRVGSDASNASLIITNAGRLSVAYASTSELGRGTVSKNNRVLIAGAGSQLSFADGLWIGSDSAHNTLTILEGGLLEAKSVLTGYGASAVSNRVTVSGANAQLSVSNNFTFGYSSDGNQLLIDDGGSVVVGGDVEIGSRPESSNTTVTVTGSNSSFYSGGLLYAGYRGSHNSLLIENGALVSAFRAYVGAYGASNTLTIQSGARLESGTSYVGTFAGGSNNVATVSGTNSSWISTGTLQIGRAGPGNILLVSTGGHVAASAIMVGEYRGTPTSNNLLQLQGGTLAVQSGQFVNVYSNNTFAGHGSVTGTVDVAEGAILSPGPSIHRLDVGGLNMRGEVLMDIAKNGTATTNDTIASADQINYGGTITVSDLGPTALASGDSFKLFDGARYWYYGSTPILNLPALPAGLSWTDNLLIDGTIEVTGVPESEIADVMLSGSNVVFSIIDGAVTGSWSLLTTTNLLVGLEDWITNKTGSFDGSGGAVITNTIDPAIPHQSFRLVEP